MNIDDQHGTVLKRKTEYKPHWRFSHWLIGRPLQTADAPHETIGKAIGLAVFSSDALSSTAYATQEMMVILAIAGAAAYRLIVPLTLAIILLLAIVTISYEQTIHEYPGGGGAYVVSRDNLGYGFSTVAVGALLTDYVLTVAVSISSAVAQIVSAFPEIYEFRVWVACGLVLVIMVLNLRGVRESGKALALPTFYFIGVMALTVIVGIFRYFTGSLGMVENPPALEHVANLEPMGLFLLLRAFSSGTTALTGVEAISNGIPAFKEPKSKNAGITLIWMSAILAVLLLGISFLTAHIQAVPSEYETIISQLARTVFGLRGLLYLMVIVGTTLILWLAANTSFAGFPRLSAIAATDGLLPRQLAYRGSRLVYSRGIVFLAIISCVLIIVFQASVTRLIPLYAIGVFLSFTLSQAGMARRLWKVGHLSQGQEITERGSTLRPDAHWMLKMIVNAFGALLTALVVVIFSITKFKDGAWIVIIIIPVLITIFTLISRHYRGVAESLTLDDYVPPARIVRQRVILLISGVHRGSMTALRYARTLSDDITAVHVCIEPADAEKIQQKWEIWGDGIRLVILDSPYRLFIEPLLEYINEIDEHRAPNEVITIVVPQFIPKNPVSNLLHTRTADTLRTVLLGRKEIVIMEVPYLIE